MTVTATWRAIARNDSTTSENKIHDDLVAKRYGFEGGLVPGVNVYAYGTRAAVDAFGVDWLERGAVEYRLAKPLYEGEIATATVASGSLEVVNPDGVVCLDGSVQLTDAPPEAPDVPAGGELPALRPDATMATLESTSVLAPVHGRWDDAEAAHWLEFFGDDHPIYRDDGVAHPGWLARFMNTVLSSNVLLGPWIHVSSQIQHHSVVHLDDEVECRARVTDVWERKGHEFVDLDVLLLAAEPVLSGRHRAIFRPRIAD